MRIARLELHGFKSFADRTTFHFGPGISCVVGPNGCGKSNVVDALKWVIGEMSARSLRGEDMLDVIFAGSSERKPVGYAEVALTFSADQGEPFPGDWARYTEIQVARRLYRDSTSEYLVNQTRCRRKDIVDLIMDSGVGNHLYSFIEQGRIDKIVSASPVDRRSLIDEAAGITRYKQRREEARQKLEATCTQLDRAADVVAEMARRLATLEKQVHKAARYRRLRALVRQEEIVLALVKHQELAGGIHEADTRSRALNLALVEAEERAASGEEDLVLRQGEAEVASASAMVLRDHLAELDARRREDEALRQAEARRAAELRRQLALARQEIDAEISRRDTARVELGATGAELDQVQGQLAAIEVDARAARARATEAEAAREVARARLREAEQAEGQATGTLREAELRAELLRGQERELPGRKERLAERRRAVHEEGVVLAKRLVVAEEAAQEQRASIRTAAAEQERAQEALDEVVRRDLHARDAVGRAEAELDAAQREYGAAVGDAESSAGRAEVEIANAVGAVQQAEEARLRDAERVDAATLAGLEGTLRKRVSEASLADAAAVDAARREADAAIEAWRISGERAFEEQDAAWVQRIEAATREQVVAVEAEEARLRAELGQQLGELRQRRDAAEKQAEQAREAFTSADARLAVAQRELREIDGKLAAMDAQERAAASRDAGTRAVREALPEVPSLIDRVRDPLIRRLLGGRLLLPVVSSPAQVLTAARAAAGRHAQLVLLPEGAEDAGLLGGAAVVDDLEQALASHLAGGRAAIVRGSGERVDADGLVRLGSVGEEADQVLARRAEAERLRGRRDEVEELVRRAQGDGTAARAQQEAGRILARKAVEALEGAEKAGHERLRHTLAEVRKEVERRLHELRGARDAWRRETRPGIDRELARLRAERDVEIGRRRSEADARTEALRLAGDAELAELRARLDAGRAEVRAEGDGRVEQARAAIRERVRHSTSDLQVRREELRLQVDRCARALQTARARGEELARVVQDARDAVARPQRTRAEIERVLARVEAEAAAAREQREQVEQRRQRLDVEIGQLEAESMDLAQRLVQAINAADGAREVCSAAIARRAEADATAQTANTAWSEATAARDQADLQLSTLRDRALRLDGQREAAARREVDAGQRIAAAAARIDEIEGGVAAAASAERSAEERLTSTADERQDAALRWEAARQQEERARAEHQRVSDEVTQVTIRRDRLQRDALGVEQEGLRLRSELSGISGRIEERYQVDLAALGRHLAEASGVVLEAPEEVKVAIEIGGRKVDAVEDLVLRPEMLRDEAVVRAFVGRIEEHRTELGRIGDVHLGALDEYLDVKTRHDELEAQRGDLDASVQSIRSAIARMNKTCRERFRETFDRVDEAFRKAYPDLVGGGEARLELTDEEDLLETGVEVVVRPPGKRLQSLSLLSGGEKAMTAIALLLGLFSVKPSPFCVLDEVDAPLDEANGARFNDMLRQMAGMTQFIVITHNRKTMECADTLYGITMPTPGCSALVSVRVDP